MQRFLMLLLFISYVSNEKCKGASIAGRWECPNGTKLIEGECIKIYESLNCPNGTELIQGECVKIPESLKCQNGTELFQGECVMKCPFGYIRIFDGRCVKSYYEYPPIQLYKPVIYLYTEESMDISVQLNLKNSKFITIYPKFNGNNTWNVRVKPNGDILIKDKTYPYLFWEAESYNSQETNEGFIINEENAEKFLEEKLDILGLNEKEKTDFITFWLPVLLKNKLSLCTFQTEKFFNNYELNITPKPDSMIRIFLTIKKLERPIKIREQKLESIKRKGFAAVEWGGSNI